MSKYPLRWDHIVHMVNQLDDPIRQLGQLGLTAALGGEHPRWGTSNALAHFGLTYIEFITMKDKEKMQQLKQEFQQAVLRAPADLKPRCSASADNELVNDIVAFLPEQQLINRVALRCDKHKIESIYKRLQQEEGLALMDLIPGSRKTLDGELLEWKIFFIKGEDEGSAIHPQLDKKTLNKVAYPFLLEWGADTDADRLQWLNAKGVNKPHALSSQVVLQHVVWEVEEPALLADRWSTLFQLPKVTATVEGASVPALEAGEGGQLFVFKKGTRNGIVALEIEGGDNAQKGKMVKVGDTEYRFI